MAAFGFLNISFGINEIAQNRWMAPVPTTCFFDYYHAKWKILYFKGSDMVVT